MADIVERLNNLADEMGGQEIVFEGVGCYACDIDATDAGRAAMREAAAEIERLKDYGQTAEECAARILTQLGIANNDYTARHKARIAAMIDKHLAAGREAERARDEALRRVTVTDEMVGLAKELAEIHAAMSERAQPAKGFTNGLVVSDCSFRHAMKDRIDRLAAALSPSPEAT